MRLLTTALVGGMVAVGLATAGPAAADPTCEVRSAAHVAEAGGMQADNAWHIAHGQLPTCNPDSGAQSADNHRDTDKKSRYCRKHWYC